MTLDVLQILYESLDGPSWATSANWRGLDGCQRPTDHAFVTCPRDRQVVEHIDFTPTFANSPPPASIRGTLPTQIGLLTELKTLRLSSEASWPSETALSGTLPTELALLTKLTTLKIVATRLSGTLPNDIGNTAPPFFGHPYPRNGGIMLAHNRLSGTIPSSLTKMERWMDPTDIWNSGRGEDVMLDLRWNFFLTELPANLATYCTSSLGFPRCIGLPPLSCSAFGERAALSIASRKSCRACPSDAIVVLQFLAVVGVVGVGALVGIVKLYLLSMRHPETRMRLVATASLVFAQAQTVCVLNTI